MKRTSIFVISIIMMMIFSFSLVSAYDNSQYGFSITPPAGWSVEENTADVFVMFTDDYSGSSINVGGEETTLSLSEAVSNIKPAIATFENYNLVSEGSRVIGGLDCYEIVFTWSYEGIDLKVKQVYFVELGKAFFVTCTALESQYANYSSDFENSLETFRIAGANPQFTVVDHQMCKGWTSENEPITATSFGAGDTVYLYFVISGTSSQQYPPSGLTDILFYLANPNGEEVSTFHIQGDTFVKTSIDASGDWTITLFIEVTEVVDDTNDGKWTINGYDENGLLVNEEFTVEQEQEPEPAPPVASFTYSPIAPQVNDTIAFDASGCSDADGTIVSYLWDFGDGDASTRQNPTHVYDQEGSYSVTLTITDDNGLTDTTTVSIAEVVIPEFPSWALVLVALTFVAVVGVVYKKKLKALA